VGFFGKPLALRKAHFSTRSTASTRLRLEIDAMQRLSSAAAGAYFRQKASTAFIGRRLSMVT
jgi:hypothetical protein